MHALSLLLAASLSADAPAGVDAPDHFVGRWNLRIVDADDSFTGGWLKIERGERGLAGSLVWRWGSVVAASKTAVEGGTLRVTREESPGKQDAFEARREGAGLKGQVRYADGKVHHFEGRPAPELPAASAPRWGEPLALFDGKTLQGWRLRDPKAKRGWAVVKGELAVVDPEGNADLVSERSFQDLKLHVEFNVDPHSNSGVYLRGRYEIQILDDSSKAADAHGCGALYSRIAPRPGAAGPAGQWQSYDITLVGRRLTVVLNGKTVIDDAYVDGITGGAIDPFEGEPGPLMLQGDHGKVRFRNIVLTPAQ